MPDVEGDKLVKTKFTSYPIGYFHIDTAEVRTAEGKVHLFVAIDRTSKSVGGCRRNDRRYPSPRRHCGEGRGGGLAEHRRIFALFGHFCIAPIGSNPTLGAHV